VDRGVYSTRSISDIVWPSKQHLYIPNKRPSVPALQRCRSMPSYRLFLRFNQYFAFSCYLFYIYSYSSAGSLSLITQILSTRASRAFSLGVFCVTIQRNENSHHTHVHKTSKWYVFLFFSELFISLSSTAFMWSDTPGEVVDLTNTLGACKAVENCTPRNRLKCTHSLHKRIQLRYLCQSN
jgi:hypothetical protein